MKKLLALLAVAGVMAACNNNGDSETTVDSTTVTETTNKMSIDTMNPMIDTMNKMPADTMN